MVMDIYKLDLEWQYIMLAHHVADMIEDVEDGGIFLAGKHIGVLKKRMEVIRKVQKMTMEGSDDVV
jgi:hypothetical protein